MATYRKNEIKIMNIAINFRYYAYGRNFSLSVNRTWLHLTDETNLSLHADMLVNSY